MGKSKTSRQLTVHINLAQLFVYNKLRQDFVKLNKEYTLERTSSLALLNLYLSYNKELVSKHNALINDLLLRQEGIIDSDFGVNYSYFLEGSVYNNYARYKLCNVLFKSLASKYHPDKGNNKELFLLAKHYRDNLELEGLQFMQISNKEDCLTFRQNEGIVQLTSAIDGLRVSRVKRRQGLAYIIAKIHFKDRNEAKLYIRKYLTRRIRLLTIKLLRTFDGNTKKERKGQEGVSHRDLKHN